MTLSKAWDKLSQEKWHDLNPDKIILFQREEEPVSRNLGLVFVLDTSIAQKMHADLQAHLPEEFHDSMIFQPYEGYHFTLQWTPTAYESIDTGMLIDSLTETFSDIQSFSGRIGFPVLGQVGLLAMGEDEIGKQISRMRQRLEDVWDKHSLEQGIEVEHYDLAYLSMTRFTQRCNVEQLQTLLELNESVIVTVTFKEVKLVINDKFLTPKETQILHTFTLQ